MTQYLQVVSFKQQIFALILHFTELSMRMVLADKIYLTPIFQFANISFLSTSSNLCRLKLFSDSSALKKDPPTQFVSESLKKYLTNKR